MAIIPDVKATQMRTTSGRFLAHTGRAIERCRLRGVLFEGSGSAGRITITNGQGGPALLDFNYPAGQHELNVTIPGAGILASDGLYLETLTNVVSIVLFYDG